MKDTLFTGPEARKRLQAGIKKSAIAVGGTMGTGGSNALIEAIESPGHMATNDGATILSSIHFEDPIEEMGRKVLLEAVSRSNRASGDGSSTATVITAAIIEEGDKYLETDAPMDIKKSLEACIPIIEESIKAQTREITEKEVGQVATISAEDPEIGARIQEIYEKIGKSGIIYWDISKTAEDSYSIGTGITVDGAGYVSPYMCDASESGQNTNQVRIQDPYILITKQKITSAADFNDLFLALNNRDIKDVVVFCDDYDPLVIPDIIRTRAMRGFRAVMVKMPVLWKDWWYEDLAKATGAKIVDPVAGFPLKNATVADLGQVDSIIVTKDQTFLDGIKDMAEHIKELEAKADDEGAIRASRLNTKTARYFVGAHSDSALSYRRLKVEDAIASAYQALNGGIVSGGGSALLNVSAVLKEMEGNVGAQILSAALEAPARQIYANAGARVPDYFAYSGTDIGGFDSRTKTEVGDMFKAGIIDPANVVLNACRNAISVGAAVLTANTIVLLPRQEEPVSIPTQPVVN
jgi:chaperonin GroEL